MQGNARETENEIQKKKKTQSKEIPGKLNAKYQKPSGKEIPEKLRAKYKTSSVQGNTRETEGEVAKYFSAKECQGNGRRNTENI